MNTPEQKTVYVKWDPLREVVCCVHYSEDSDTCDACNAVHEEGRHAYFLEGKTFIIQD